MSSYIADIGEAIATAINDGLGSSEELEAAFVFVPLTNLENITERIVRVYPLVAELSPLTRADIRSDVQIRVVYGEKLNQISDPSDPAANVYIKPMLELGEQIGFAIAGTRTYAGAALRRVEHTTVFDASALVNHRIFVGALTAYLVRSS